MITLAISKLRLSDQTAVSGSSASTNLGAPAPAPVSPPKSASRTRQKGSRCTTQSSRTPLSALPAAAPGGRSAVRAQEQALAPGPARGSARSTNSAPSSRPLWIGAVLSSAQRRGGPSARSNSSGLPIQSRVNSTVELS